MESEKPSMVRRALAVLVLVVVAVLALRLAVGFVVGVVSAVFWVVVVAVLIVVALWARSTLKSARRERRVERSPARAVSAPPSRRGVEGRRNRQELAASSLSCAFRSSPRSRSLESRSCATRSSTICKPGRRPRAAAGHPPLTDRDGVDTQIDGILMP